MSSVFFPEPKKNVDRSSTLKSSSHPVRTTSFHTNSTSWTDGYTCCRILDPQRFQPWIWPKSWKFQLRKWGVSKVLKLWGDFCFFPPPQKKTSTLYGCFQKMRDIPQYSSILIEFSHYKSSILEYPSFWKHETSVFLHLEVFEAPQLQWNPAVFRCSVEVWSLNNQMCWKTAREFT